MAVEVLQERDQAGVAMGFAVGQYLNEVTVRGESSPLRCPEENPDHPIRKVFSQKQEVVFLQFVKEPLGAPGWGLKITDVLEQVLIRNDVAAGRGELAHQVIDGGPGELLLARRQIVHFPGRVGYGQRSRRIAETHLVDRLLQQRIERRGHVQVEIRDLRQLPQWLCRAKGSFLHNLENVVADTVTILAVAQQLA